MREINLAKEITIVLPESGPANQEGTGLFVDGIFIPVNEVSFTCSAAGVDVVTFAVQRHRVKVETLAREPNEMLTLEQFYTRRCLEE